MLLGCIGDDFTGSSDLANTLAKQGMRTVQYTGVPNGPAGAHVEAGVVALRASVTLAIALKSSNFGAPDYFSKAARILGAAP